jgi:hypothetical protein
MLPYRSTHNWRQLGALMPFAFRCWNIPKRGDLVLQPRRSGLRQFAFLTVRRLQRRQIVLVDACHDLVQAAPDRAASERSAGPDELKQILAL